ncbi:MAG: 2-(1,2-epoxy,2-dihydrophenyl)acetyl-CoA isomerase [Actinomycetia bacterium]|nr:2-(1,2-epoxy,2-dihydrophenyl)acetyl-CoA isomerase [Actinomycetes bacterium]
MATPERGGMHAASEGSESAWASWRPERGDFQELQLERNGPMLRVTLNQPKKLNAVTRRAFEELLLLRSLFTPESGLQLMILTGAGRGFCSGADIEDFIGHRDSETVTASIPDAAGRFFPVLDDFPVPVIAAVNGPAAGDGMSLAIMADFRVASDNAFFVESHVARDLTPSVLAWYLPRMIGLGRAYEMVVLGRRVPAATALEWGLVTSVVPPEQLLEAADQLGTELLALPSFAMLTARGAMQRAASPDISSVREWAGSMEALALALRQRKDATDGG